MRLRRPRGVDVLVLLDGPDPDAEARLARDGVPYLSKKVPGPAKGHALAFLAESMGARLDDYAYILVFDADMRLPEGFFRDLRVPEGVEVFQLPVRPSGVPAPGAPRVEALSLAEAFRDDLARSDAGMPVRLRGKAMGFSPAGLPPRPRRRDADDGRGLRGDARAPRAGSRRARAGRPRRLRRAPRGRGRDGAVAGAVVRRAPEALLHGLHRSRSVRAAAAGRDFRAGGGFLAPAEDSSAWDPRVSCRRLGRRYGDFFFEWRVGGGLGAGRSAPRR